MDARNPFAESNFRIAATEHGTHLVHSDSERFGKDAIVYESHDRMDCVDYITQRRPDSRWQVYVISDLATWARNDNEQAKIEYFDMPHDAITRFEQLLGNSENALCDDMAHLTMGISREDGMSAVDVLHVRDGKNCLIDDFTRASAVNTSRNALNILSEIADRVGFSHVREYIKDEDGRFRRVDAVALPLWNNPYFPVKDPQATIEKEFITQPFDSFAIYQLKRGDATFDYRFEPMERLEKLGLSVDRANYDLVYVGSLPPARKHNADKHLNALYEQFNYDRPADFQGHSMSVSDVIALKMNGRVTCHYVDRWGFQELPGFLRSEQFQAQEKRPSVVEQIKQKPVKEARPKAQKPKNKENAR